jgi:hypothetical protein
MMSVIFLAEPEHANLRNLAICHSQGYGLIHELLKIGNFHGLRLSKLGFATTALVESAEGWDPGW